MGDEHVRMCVNGQPVERRVPARHTLADVLRDGLGLHGTKVSCSQQVCGSCTVLVDRRPVSSCSYLAGDASGRRVDTIEGMAQGNALHPIQQAFVDAGAIQCGYCTPGFVMATQALLDVNTTPTREEILHALEGNICRCTGYQNIVDAIEAVAR